MQMQIQKRIPQLDALRGLAILVVIVHNSGALPRLSADGWMGVDLFFVLSGFLITGILIDSRQSESYFKTFYLKRCLRIWPLYFSLLLFMFVVVPSLRPSEAPGIFARSAPWWSYILFVQNLLVRFPTMATGALAVTWSLAIEEQFYFVWPWALRYFSLAHVRRIAIAVLCLSPLLRLYLSSPLSSHPIDTYPNSFCRLDGLMAGALLALAIRAENFVPSKFIRNAWITLAIAAPSAFLTEALHARWIAFSFVAIACASFVYLAMFSTQKWLQSALSNRFLIYTGTISYGLYLLHKFPLDAAKVMHFDRHPLLVLPLAIVASYALAALSWHFMEQPFMRLKRFFGSQSLREEVAMPPALVLPQEDVSAA